MRLGAGLAALLLACAPAHADVGDLDPGLPTEVADAETAEPGARELQARLRWDRDRTGADELLVEGEVQYGFAERWHAAIGTGVIAGSGERIGSGDILLELMHRFNDETRWLPATAALLQAELPTGRQSAGVDTRLRLIATKTLAMRPELQQVHLNAAWIHNAAPAPAERADRWRAIAGYSMLLGEKVAFIVDFIRQQDRQQGSMSNILEAGVRREVDSLRRDAVVSFGVGHGWGSESAPRVRIVAGLELPF